VSISTIRFCWVGCCSISSLLRHLPLYQLYQLLWFVSLLRHLLLHTPLLLLHLSFHPHFLLISVRMLLRGQVCHLIP
jgi:hypothetical protein